MATKKFIIEVEEGHTECKDCPFRVTSKMCDAFECNRINLATIRIKEYNVPDCYDLQCEARKPKLNIELEAEK